MNRSCMTFGIVASPAAMVATLFVAACGAGSDGGGSAWTVAADTADGVLRVVNTPPESGPWPTLAAVEELRVGTLEGGGPASFGQIRSIAVLPDGRVAVADGQAEEVRLVGRSNAGGVVGPVRRGQVLEHAPRVRCDDEPGRLDPLP